MAYCTRRLAAHHSSRQGVEVSSPGLHMPRDLSASLDQP